MVEGDALMRDAEYLEQPSPRISQNSPADAPIRRLSEDLLYELFMTIAGGPSLQSCDIAVRLSHVCCDWRAILLRGPLFWTFVALHGSSDHSATVESLFCRSQDYLITVALFLETSCTVGDSSLVLQRHAPRIRSLHVYTPEAQTLSSHLRHVSAIHFPSLQEHKTIVPANRLESFTAVACAGEPKSPDSQMPLVAGIPTWPPHLHVTSLSFTYSSFNLLSIFSMLSMTRVTLQHLKLYFDAETHSNLQDIAGPPIEFSELRSLALGFHDPLSPLPFLWRAQLLTLDSLLIEDIRSPVQQREPTHNTLLHQLLHSVDPVDALFAVLLQVLRDLTPTSLRLVGLASTHAAVDIFTTLGPHLRSLDLVDCGTGFVAGLAAAMRKDDPRWRLERLRVRGIGRVAFSQER